MTEEQGKRLEEYNEKLSKMWAVFEKYPTQSISDSIARVYEEMEEDELLEGVLEL